MVKIYYQTKAQTISLSEFGALSPDDLIRKVTLHNDPTQFAFLYHGRRILAEDMKQLSDDDCLRIFQLPYDEFKTSTEEIAEMDSVDDLLIKIRTFLKTYGQQVLDIYHNETNAGTHVQKFILKYPDIRYDALALSALTDFYLFISYSSLNWHDSKIRLWLKEHPSFFTICDKILEHILDSVYSGSYAQRPPSRYQYPPQQRAPVAPPITTSALQNALAIALGQAPGASGSGSAAVPHVVPPAAAPAPAVVQPEPDYSEQLAQLREFGFQDEQICRAVLQQANGDLQLALELIVEMME